MFKSLHFKSLLLLCALVVGSVSGRATTVTYSLTPDQSSTGSTATSYITTLTEFTYDDISWKMKYWNPKSLQIKTNDSNANNEFRFYNTSAFSGRITQVVITFSALTISDASKFMFIGGTSEVSTTTGGTAGTWNSTAKTLTWTPGVSDNFTYFAFYQNGKAASGSNYLASSDAIVVTYDITPQITASPCPLAVPNYIVGTAEPTYETLTVNGSNLSTDITLTLDDNSNFEISSDLSTWSSTSLSLTPSSGKVTDEEIAVRLKAGLAKDDYAGTITLSSTGADDVTVNLSGKVTRNTYDIEQHSTPATAHGAITFSPTSPIEEGAEVTLTAVPAEGYDFTADSWVFYKESGEIFVLDNSITVTDNKFIMPSYPVHVDATFAAKPTYAITCEASPAADGTIEASPTSAYEGQIVTLSYLAEDNYSLTDIAITKTSDGSATGITLTASDDDYIFTMPGYPVTVTATFTPNFVEGSFIKVTSVDALEDGEYYILYDTKAMNSTCINGEMGATNVTISNSIISNPDKSIVWKLEANGDKWNLYNEKVNKYCYIEGSSTSSFKMGETSSQSYSVTVNNNVFQFQTTQENNTRCIGYNSNSKFKSYASNNNPAPIVELYKLTVLINRTITFNGNGGTDNNEGTYTQTVYDGIATTLEANKFTKSNNVFLGWSTTPNGSVEYDDEAEVTISGDLTLYAVWSQLYTAMVDDQIANGTVSIDDGGSSTDAIETVEGTEITLTYDAADGYMFEAWNVYNAYDETTIVTVTNNKFNMPAYDVIISATFVEIPTYTLTIDNTIDGGTVSVSENVASAIEGTEITLSYSASTGHVFKAWNVYKADDATTKVTVTNNNKFNMPAYNVVVSASFIEIPTYTLATSITSGKHYIIVGMNSATNYYAMGKQDTNNRSAVSISVSGTTASIESTDVYEFAIFGPDANGNYSIYDANTASTGYLYAASSSKNYLRTQAKNDSNGKWAITFSENSASIVASGTNRNVMQFNNTNSIFSCYASNSLLPVYLYEKDGEVTPTEDKSLNSYGFATYCSQNALDFSDYATAGYSAWQITGVSGDAITFSQITGSVPAGTGLFLMGSSSVTLKSAGGAVTNTEVAGNKLEGVIADKTVVANQYYGLSGNAFVPVNAGTIPAGKALLPASVVEGLGARLTFIFEDANGIADIEHSTLNIEDSVYNLNGQRVNNPKRGLYIVNGKKVVMK